MKFVRWNGSSYEEISGGGGGGSSHTHANLSVLNQITQALLNSWNTAATWVSTNGANVLSHLSDTVKHITSAERTAWNGKADAVHTQADTTITMTDYPGNLQEAYAYAGQQVTNVAAAAEEAYILAGSKLSDAPSDGSQYARQNGEWRRVQSGGGGSFPGLIYRGSASVKSGSNLTFTVDSGETAIVLKAVYSSRVYTGIFPLSLFDSSATVCAIAVGNTYLELRVAVANGTVTVSRSSTTAYTVEAWSF